MFVFLFYYSNFIADYGVVHELECEKYQLMTKESDMDLHYIDHVQGYLHVNDSSEPYSIDEYCVEYLKINNTIEVNIEQCHSSKFFHINNIN